MISYQLLAEQSVARVPLVEASKRLYPPYIELIGA